MSWRHQIRQPSMTTGLAMNKETSGKDNEREQRGRKTAQRPESLEWTGLRPGAPKLSYGKIGSGEPTVLYLHGLGARWSIFRPMMRRLAQVGTHYALDLRGHGDSDWTSDDYSIESFGEDVAEFIREVCGGKVSVFGHSLGGWVALYVAATYPELVENLIIADIVLYPGREGVSKDLGFYLDGREVSIRSISDEQRRMDPVLYEAFMDGTFPGDVDSDAAFRKLEMDVLLLQADPEKGARMTDEDLELALPHFKQARVRRIVGAGHTVHLDVPDLVESIISEQIGV